MTFKTLRTRNEIEGREINALIESKTGHRFDPQEEMLFESNAEAFLRIDAKRDMPEWLQDAYDAFASTGIVDLDTGHFVIEAAVNLAIVDGLLPAGRYEINYRT